MAIYPNFLAGQRLTAGRLAASQPLIAQKVTTTDRPSVTVFADDPDLTLQLAAAAVYLVEIYISYSAPSPGLLKTTWTVPAGATGNRTATGPGSSATDNTADNIGMHSGVHGFATSVVYGTRGNTGNQSFTLETSLVTSGAGGKLALAWAQSASSATPTRVAAGSWVRALRVS